MLVGLYLLLYVGGLFADEQFNLMAAQGDSDIALPGVVAQSPPARDDLSVRPSAEAQPSVTPAVKPQPIVEPQPAVAAPTAVPEKPALPQFNNPGQGRELSSLVPAAAVGYGPSTITRIVIPKIKVDRKVVEVGWTLEQLNGQQVAVWDVAKYAVGHHEGTANPGQAGNIVLAGHSGGHAYPFNDLYYLEAGDTLFLWSNGQQYKYTVAQRLVLDEIGPKVTFEQRRANAHYIEPTKEEVATLVTCWPLSGPNKFTQRVVIRAVPNRPT
jgi:LPXTG-site transpeptidase (sortase) family protein